MIHKHRSTLPKLFFIMALSIASLGGGYYTYVHYTQREEANGISEYQAARDRAEILALFQSDLYWLSANPDYDAAFMLDNRAPNRGNLRAFGTMQLKVLREDNKFVGFVAYYKKTHDEGFINFVCIKPEMRGKRYAEQLMQYAEQDLRKMGAQRVRLLTRTTNHRARALYTRLGYNVIELDEEGGFFYFIKIL